MPSKLSFPVALLVVGFAAAVAQNADYVGRYQDLSRRIFCCLESDPATFSFPPPQKVSEDVSTLRSLVAGTITAYLSTGASSADALRQAITRLQGRYGAFLTETNLPAVDFSTLNGTEVLVAGFAVISGGEGIPDVHPFVQFYSRPGGSWDMRSELGSDFTGTTFSVAQMTSPVRSELRYLVWGKAIGDTGARLKLRLYAFDGFSVRTLWQRDGLQGGSALVSRDALTIDYYVRGPSPGGALAPDRHVVEVLRPTVNGLEQ